MAGLPEIADFLGLGATMDACTEARLVPRLGVTFAEESRTAAFRVLKAEGSGPFAGYELREPLPGAAFRGLLIARLLPGRLRLRELMGLTGNPQPLALSPLPTANPPLLTAIYPLGRNRLGVTAIDRDDRPVESLAIHCA